jgi:hypothetical protein
MGDDIEWMASAKSRIRANYLSDHHAGRAWKDRDSQDLEVPEQTSISQEDEFAEWRAAFAEYKRKRKLGWDLNDDEVVKAFEKYINENSEEYDEFEIRIQAALLGFDSRTILSNDIRGRKE